jgi:hypothetical protein
MNDGMADNLRQRSHAEQSTKPFVDRSITHHNLCTSNQLIADECSITNHLTAAFGSDNRSTRTIGGQSITPPF